MEYDTDDHQPQFRINRWNALKSVAFFIGGTHLFNFISLCFDFGGTQFILWGLVAIGLVTSIVPWVRLDGEWLLSMSQETRLMLSAIGAAIKLGLVLTVFVGK